MAELFIELFSEEIPSQLQRNARKEIKLIIEEKLNLKEIKFSINKSFSTPKRLVFFIDGLPKKIEQKSKNIKGPKVGSPNLALEGFMKSNKLKKTEIYKKKLEKGEFYFGNSKPKIINVLDELQQIIPNIIQSYQWKKSMKWSNYELRWGRPLRSILAIFDKQVVKFKLFHLTSSNLTIIDDNTEEKQKVIKNFKSYLSILKNHNIILDQEERKDIILKKFNSICILKNLKK